MQNNENTNSLSSKKELDVENNENDMYEVSDEVSTIITHALKERLEKNK